MTFKFS